MGSPIKITERVRKAIPDGMHFAFRFSDDGDDIGIRVSFDLVADCVKSLHADTSLYYCTPQNIRLEHVHIEGYLESHILPWVADMMIDFGLTDPVITPVPAEKECVRVHLDLNGFYHDKHVPVVIAKGQGSITLMGSATGTAGTTPTFTESIDCTFCCKKCELTCICDPPPQDF